MKIIVASITVAIFASFFAISAPGQDIKPGTDNKTTLTPPPQNSSTGFDFDKLKVELDKQKSVREKVEAKVKSKTTTPSLSSVGIKLTLYLLVLIILFFVISRVIKGSSRKMLPARLLNSFKSKSKTMEVLDSLNLGQGRMLNLVRIQNQVLVLGLSQQRIEPLLNITEEKTVRSILETLEMPSVPMANFAQHVDYHLEALKKEEGK
jgi:flagellar biogenesis protein FliO